MQITSLKSPHSPQPPLPEAPNESSSGGSESNSPSKGNSNNTTPPPPYDQAHSPTPNSAMILSTIAENDASPYSTNSTVHTMNNSRSYPTTTSIFGRKPSPPPLEELPPLPTVTVSTTSSSNSSVKSDHHHRISRNPNGDHDIPFASNGNGKTVPGEMHGRVNEGYETDEGEDGRRYMTIAEVNECRAELEKKLALQQQQQQLTPPPLPLVHKDSQRNPSDDLVPIPTSASVTTSVAPVPARSGPTQMLRQDAVCMPDLNTDTHTTTSNPQPVFTVVPSGSTHLAETSLTNEMKAGQAPPAKIEAEEDDGYHERVSYSEDDETSNHSGGEKGSNSGTNVGSRKTSSIHPPSLQSLEGGVKIRSKDVLFQYPSTNFISDSDLRAPSPQNADTLRSNASDSDISHISISSVDQTLPAPTRQKPVRRRKTQHDLATSELSSSNGSSAPPENDTTPSKKDATKDHEVFVWKRLDTIKRLHTCQEGLLLINFMKCMLSGKSFKCSTIKLFACSIFFCNYVIITIFNNGSASCF